MKVYRVENQRNIGPYIGRLIPGKAYPHQPAPSWGIIFNGCKFGFASPEQMLDWFDIETLEVMSLYGFYVSVYEVPHKFVKFDTHQLSFKWYMARCEKIILLNGLKTELLA